MKLRQWLFSVFAVQVVGCASPRHMDYQRSKFEIKKVGNFLVTTSPNYFNRELEKSYANLTLNQSVLVQNAGPNIVKINLQNAKAYINKDLHEVSCKSLQAQTELEVKPNEKAQINCVVTIGTATRPKVDLMVVIQVPLENEKWFESYKVVRVEDFDEQY